MTWRVVGMHWVRDGTGWERRLFRRHRVTGELEVTPLTHVDVSQPFCLRCLATTVFTAFGGWQTCTTCHARFVVMHEPEQSDDADFV